MARPCPICSSELSKRVRDWSQSGKGPKTIANSLSKYHGMTLTSRQVAYHCKEHDPEAGTFPIQRAAAVAARQEALEVKEELGKELVHVKTLGEKLETVLNVLLDAGEQLDAEKIAKMDPRDLVRMMKDGADLAIKLKKVEIDERKARHDVSYEIDEIKKMMGKIATKTKRSSGE